MIPGTVPGKTPLANGLPEPNYKYNGNGPSAEEELAADQCNADRIAGRQPRLPAGRDGGISAAAARMRAARVKAGLCPECGYQPGGRACAAICGQGAGEDAGSD